MNPQEELDVATLLIRLCQIDKEESPDHWLWATRVMQCDVPRLLRQLEPEMQSKIREHYPEGIAS